MSSADAWRHEFINELYHRCNGAVNREWLEQLFAALYPLNGDRDPRQAAEVAFIALGFNFPSGYDEH